MAHQTQNAIGIIGGTGLYDIDGFENAQWVTVESAFGEPSDQLLIGDFEGHRVVFLPRHGRGHRISPTGINYRANIEALKRAGVDRVVSFSAVGSLKEKHKPGDFVLVDQFVDRTFAREKSFFGTGFVAHVSMADPVCSSTQKVIADAAWSIGQDCAVGGTYMVMEGPQFSSRAESQLYRRLDCDVIGMTNMPEAKLAREAELAYATVAMVTDYDCWHDEHDDVSTASILEVLKSNNTHAKDLIRALVPQLANLEAPFESGVHRSLQHAIATAPDHRDPELTAKLQVVAGRVINAAGW
ncbi:MAG TPA: S-methyl-5'-thioadenosine phosphorylase [Dehalococcoidia bacterium]|nr:S-methyl-5'-thioadenosine phosphorylase [Dehalococcoidia bacterium]|tara:strand:+ start:3161 stop:4054 length:894 start_codon:yes stop_codon:yes gene_type:complete